MDLWRLERSKEALFTRNFKKIFSRADRDTMMGNIGGGGQDPAWSPQVNQPFPQPAGFNQP